MRALVTGVAGFVGSTLAKQLLSEGHEVVGIDVLTDYYEVSIKRGNLASIPETGFTFVQADLNTVDLGALLVDVDWIFHQAGQPGVRMSWGKDFAIYVRQNIEATQRLLEAAKDAPRLKRMVYASSSSIYGNAERYPTSEDDRPQPVSPYGVTKLAAEHLCSLYASNFGVPTVSLRYFTVYGPGQRTDMAFTRFVRAAVLDELISIYGTGEQIRDFTYVEDVVAANIAAASTDGVTPGTVLNVAGGSNVSVLDTLRIISDLNGKPLRVEHTESVKGDVFRTGGDTAKIARVLGWQPTVTIEEGLARHLDWAKKTFGPQA
ncbi:MAG: NAD-dependent epimerase/dehydratase family protein [Propionibacteriaceae bacterium]|uniref:Nucleoside-diphosphate-sugar epimerase n=1 Tax=Microlunatus antarcticus TaxID=53388 RepID=A0A7W5JYW9_9ACTN|nr:NAD-dependent epimerase/dehydratase family protein [Microlunatus antarcticus]MBB3328187.1 nucleoside-diphosphate-sugar epimerase [Microlunatus antarcticus]RYZ25058.1 MAG: NAD-dependent epimerase/dehydratase family protein [Propionibacteriaceae bacterium]